MRLKIKIHDENPNSIQFLSSVRSHTKRTTSHLLFYRRLPKWLGGYSCPFLVFPPGGWLFFDFGTNESPQEIIGESAYCFFLIPNAWSFLLAIGILGFQVVLFIILWYDTRDDNDTGDLSGRDRTAGIVGAAFLLALRVSTHLGQGFELMVMGLFSFFPCLPNCLPFCKSDKQRDYEDHKDRAFLLFCVGLVMFAVASMTIWIGVETALRSDTVTLVITKVTVATFIERVDEDMYAVLKYFSKPKWYEEAMEKLGSNYPKEPDPNALSADEILKLRRVIHG